MMGGCWRVPGALVARVLSVSFTRLAKNSTNGESRVPRGVHGPFGGLYGSRGRSQPHRVFPPITPQPWEPSYPWSQALRVLYTIRVSLNGLSADRALACSLSTHQHPSALLATHAHVIGIISYFGIAATQLM